MTNDPATLSTLQAAHETTPHGDLAGAFRSAVAFLRQHDPRARIKGRTEAQQLATVRHAQGVARRLQAWERGTMQALSAKAAKRAAATATPPDDEPSGV